jgi:fermentation-respiration switch protein FrsA (DUF1100 family)
MRSLRPRHEDVVKSIPEIILSYRRREVLGPTAVHKKTGKMAPYGRASWLAAGAMKSLLWVVLIIASLLCFAVAATPVAALLWQQADRVVAAPASGRFIHAHDVDVYVQEWGSVGGPAILLIHAAGGWRARGCRSGAAWPERIAGLILVDAALNLDAPPRQHSLVGDLLAWSPARKLIAATTLSNPLFTKTLLRMFVAKSESVTPYWIATYQRPLNVRGTYSATADWLPELLDERDDDSVSRHRTSFAQLTAPTLVIWGRDDAVTPLEQGESIAKSIQSSKLVVLPAVGHMPPIEAEQAFDNAVLEFLRSQAAILQRR